MVVITRVEILCDHRGSLPWQVPNGFWLPASLLALATIIEAPIAVALCPVDALLAPESRVAP